MKPNERVVARADRGKQWWGECAVPFGATRRFRIGPLTLWIKRQAGEWAISTQSSGDALDPTLEIAAHTVGSDAESSESTERFAYAATSETITLAPCPADRAIVTRPDHPYWISADESATFFVSSPLWFSLTAFPDLHLCTRPLYRPSDTWFGPRDVGGELCYATTTYCRSLLDDVPYRAHRAVTSVQIRNRSNKALLLERLKLPVDVLALYAAPDGRIWTQDIVLEHREGGEFASLEVPSRGPSRAPTAIRLTAPTREAPANLVTRAFSSLFGSSY